MIEFTIRNIGTLAVINILIKLLKFFCPFREIATERILEPISAAFKYVVGLEQVGSNGCRDSILEDLRMIPNA